MEPRSVIGGSVEVGKAVCEGESVVGGRAGGVGIGGDESGECVETDGDVTGWCGISSLLQNFSKCLRCE